MTASIKEALAAARQFVKRAPGSNAKATLVKIDAALASLSCGEARERVARIAASFDWPVAPNDERERWIEENWQKHIPLADAILATGCVPGEAAIRADERAKCEKNDLLDAMQAECWTLRCVDIPTGCGDADVAWEVVQHHMAKPHDRVIATGSTPREALAAAIRAGRGEG